MVTGPKKRKQRALTRSFVVTVAVGIPAALVVGFGCGASSDNAAPGTGTGVPPQLPGVATGKCTDEGAQQPCHFSLGKTMAGTVQSCFSGTQTCTGGHWSACGGDGTITNTSTLPGLNVAPAGAGGTGIGTQAIGPGSVVCGDGVCTPLACLGPGGPDLGKTCTVPGTGTCGGGKTCGVGESFSTCPQDCKTPGGADAGTTICTSDPCNPDCQGWKANGPISSAAGAPDSSVIGVSGFSGIPAGQLNKLLNQPCDNFSGFPSSYYNCQVDTYCQMAALGGDGTCHQFPAAAVIGTDPKGMGTTVVGMDVTMGPGCSALESDKFRYFPICNRGTVAIPAGQVIRVKYFNPVQAFNPCANNTCTSAGGFDCSMLVGDAVAKNGLVTPGDLLPGTCQLLDTQQAGMGPGGAACSQPSGEKWMYANCDGATTGVVEGDVTMNPGVATPMAANEPITAPGISGCANNWSDHAGGNNPPSCGVAGQNIISFSNDYHAVCPVGTLPVWSKLSYDTTAASNASGTAEVYFEAATAKDVAGVPGVFSPFYEMAEATDNSSGAFKKDPEVCTASTPATPAAIPTCTNSPVPTGVAGEKPCCPKDIEDQFSRLITNTPFPGAGPPVDPFQPIPGPMLARQEWLRLQITVKATPDNNKNTTLNNWSLSYQCIAVE